MFLTANNFELLLFCFEGFLRNVREQCCGRFETARSLPVLEKKMGSNTEFGGSWESNFMEIMLTI